MATAKYELMEQYSHVSRAEVGNAAAYWKNEMDALVNSLLPYYDFEIENTSQYIDKNEIAPAQAFAHLAAIRPRPATAFLFSKRNHDERTE